MDIVARLGDASEPDPESWIGTATVLATSEATLQSTAVYERDRLDAIDKACQSIGAMAYIAPDGTPMVVDIPPLADVAVWDVEAGSSGVLYEAKRSRSNERAYTAVSASAAAIDGPAPFPPQVVYDTNPDSPTYYLGPLGVVPFFMAWSCSPTRVRRGVRSRQGCRW